MSIGSVSSGSSAYNTAAAQLQGDQQKLQADEKAQAAEAQLQADDAAVTRSGLAIAVAQDSGTDPSGPAGASVTAGKPALTANAGARLDVYA